MIGGVFYAKKSSCSRRFGWKQDWCYSSHIKPWKDSDNTDRVDGDKGLSLTPTYDRLFDQGYISCTDDKQLLVSSKLNKNI
ncbi:HNH endonuclease [Lachnospiraceae bacterium LCP25S3_G4]